MKRKKIITYNLDFALSKKYFKVNKQCLEPKISNEKVYVLFVFFYFTESNSPFSFKILDFRNRMMTSKQLFEKSKYRLKEIIFI